jgi:hypothetical protein
MRKGRYVRQGTRILLLFLTLTLFYSRTLSLDTHKKDIELIDLSKVDHIFERLCSFITERPSFSCSCACESAPPAKEPLPVLRIGSYEVSIVPTKEDFERLQKEVFHLDPAVALLFGGTSFPPSFLHLFLPLPACNLSCFPSFLPSFYPSTIPSCLPVLLSSCLPNSSSLLTSLNSFPFISEHYPQNFSFIVCKLGKKATYHPIAYYSPRLKPEDKEEDSKAKGKTKEHEQEENQEGEELEEIPVLAEEERELQIETMEPTYGSLFIPTYHFHGTASKNEKADWDHAIYAYYWKKG